MDLAKYKDIAPYRGQDVLDAVERIKAYPQFLNNLAEVLYSGNVIKRKWKSHRMKEIIPPLLDKVQTYEDFQQLITAGVFLPAIVSNSMTEFSYGGLEGLEKDKA